MRKIQAQQVSPRNYLQAATQTVIVPSPVGGWNAIDPLALMEPKYAPILTNWVPRTGWVEVRPGYSAWVQNVANMTTAPVESLMTYRPATGVERLFAACNNTIFEVTTQGIPTTQQTSLSNNRWQYINFTPAGGSNYIYMVNGADPPRYFNGTTWTNAAITGSSFNINTYVNIAATKRRIWFIPANSTSVDFMPTDAITGAIAGNLDLGAIFTKGGFLQTVFNLTLGGTGAGPNDYTMFVSSRGQIALYQGIDPTNANAWSLVGVYDLPPTLGNRCTMDYGSDVVLLTLSGAIPVSQALPLDSDAIRGIALTNKIQNQMLQSAQMSQTNFGWEMSHFPAQGLFIINVPLTTNSSQVQYVMNALTGAWFQITGWNANCFALFQDNLYFGDNKGNINLAWSGGADLVTAIKSDMQCAFNYFGDPGKIKKMTMAQPLLVSSGALTPTISVDVDFSSTAPTANVITIQPAGATFGSGTFGTATFGGGSVTQGLWQAIQGEGKALAIRMIVNLLPNGVGAGAVFDTGTFDNTMVFDGFGTGTNTLQIDAFNALTQFGGVI